MKTSLLITLGLLAFSTCLRSQPFPASLAGQWTFDNLSNPLQATVGTNLLLNGTHIAVAGNGPLDGAYQIGVGSYYTCSHGIAANGGGTTVNEYSIMFDIKIPDATLYHSLYQTNMSNTNDGEIFAGNLGNIGVSAVGYSGVSVPQNTWHRLVITVDLGTSFKYYLDGHLILDGISQAVDGRFSLSIPNVLFFADENGEDNPIIVSQIAIFSTCLTEAEVHGMGGFVFSNIRPYLQSPTPNSMYVSWNSYNQTSSVVEYGTTTTLTETQSGSFENISGCIWHTVKLTGLQPGTRYYYRCISGNDTSETFPFRTPDLPGTPGSHVRFAIVSDSQSDVTQSNKVADSLLETLTEKYGTNWYDSLSLVVHTGDVTQSGSYAVRFSNEYFNSFSRISCSVPFMISIGNHEVESSYYYSYMKYEEFSDFVLPNTLNEKYYSFFLGNCQFIFLNTNGTYNNATQTTWLHEKLVQSDTTQSCDFVFVMNHQPGHSEVWPDGNSAYVQGNITGELVQFPKVTLNTHGHSHNYERGMIQTLSPAKQDYWISIIGGAGGALDRWGMYTNQTDYAEVQRSLDHYCFKLVEVDCDHRTCNASLYSMGNPDKPLNREIADTWHRYVDQPAPDKPIPLCPTSYSFDYAELIATPFSGVDSLMSSRFQLCYANDGWNSPLIDVLRNKENIYGVTPSPDFIPVDLNVGIDLIRYGINPGTLINDSTYKWRVSYRDYNGRWSDWSDSAVFTVVPFALYPDTADFISDITVGDAPLTVHFTDISHTFPIAWEWDFNEDQITDSYLRDPVYVFNVPGIYDVSLSSRFGSFIKSCTKSNFITVLDPTGRIEISENRAVNVTPNPFNTKVNINLELNEEKPVTITIYSVDGKLVNSLVTGELLSGKNTILWSPENAVKQGVYICKIETGTEVRMVRLVYLP